MRLRHPGIECDEGKWRLWNPGKWFRVVELRQELSLELRLERD